MVSKELQIGSAVAVTLGVTVLVYIIWKSLQKTRRKDSEDKSENEQDVPVVPAPPTSKLSGTDESKQKYARDEDLPKKEPEVKMPLPNIPVLPKPDTAKAGEKDINDKTVSSDKTESTETRQLSDQMQSAESNGENDSEPFVTVEKPKEIESKETEVHVVSKPVEDTSSQKENASVTQKIEQSVSSAITAVSHLESSTHGTTPPDSKTVESTVASAKENESITEKRVTDIPKEKITEPASVVPEEPKPAQSASALKSVTTAVDQKVATDDVMATDEGAGEAMMDISQVGEEAAYLALDSEDNEAGAGDATAHSNEFDSNASSFSVVSMPSSDRPSLEENLPPSSSAVMGEDTVPSLLKSVDATTDAKHLQESDTDSNTSSFSVISMPSSGQASLEQNVQPSSSAVASGNTSLSVGKSDPGSTELKIKSETTLPKTTSLDVKEAEHTSIGDTEKTGPAPKSEQKTPSKESEVKTPTKPEMKLDSEVITKAILRAQSTPASVDNKTLKILIDLLQVRDEMLVQIALDCIVRCAAFSVNQKPLRENQCPAELIRLLQSHSEIVSSGVRTSDTLLVSINNAIMNLSTDVLNQKQLEVCIPTLIDLVMHEGVSSNVQLSCLQPLTNLSTTSAYHGEYTRAIQQLYILLDSGNRAIRIQALKLLVNLSCNAHVVKNLLAAKAPNCLMELLDKSADTSLTLRMTTFLANVVTTVSKEEMTSESLPTGDKAASPETMFTAIFGVNNISKVKNKVYSLTRHDSEDISQQAARLYSALPK